MMELREIKPGYGRPPSGHAWRPSPPPGWTSCPLGMRAATGNNLKLVSPRVGSNLARRRLKAATPTLMRPEEQSHAHPDRAHWAASTSRLRAAPPAGHARAAAPRWLLESPLRAQSGATPSLGPATAPASRRPTYSPLLLASPVNGEGAAVTRLWRAGVERLGGRQSSC